MSARDEILAAVRAARPDPVPHPGVPDDTREATPTGLDTSFARAVEEAGGRVVGRDSVGEELDADSAEIGSGDGPGEDTGRSDALLAERVATLLAHRFPRARIASTVPLVAGDVDLTAVADPRELADLDVMVCRAALGVAENGAVWLPESAMGHRAAPFLAQHMVVVLARDAIVADLHDAYRAIDVAASGFGLFVAGPSKTADIEQSLVLGAHGPRSLTVLLGDGGE